MNCTTDELCSKDVINIDNGSRIGHVYDIEFDMLSGKISALLVCRGDKNILFRKGDTVRIEWNNIAVTGNETILVRNAEIFESETKNNKKITDLFTR